VRATPTIPGTAPTVLVIPWEKTEQERKSDATKSDIYFIYKKIMDMAPIQPLIANSEYDLVSAFSSYSSTTS